MPPIKNGTLKFLLGGFLPPSVKVIWWRHPLRGPEKKGKEVGLVFGHESSAAHGFEVRQRSRCFRDLLRKLRHMTHA